VIWNDFEVVLLEASVAVQLTVVVPMANVLPDGGVHVFVTPGALSVAVVTKDTTAPDGEVAFTIMFAGTVSDGGSVSTTFTRNDPEDVLPEPSVAVQLTVVVPIAKAVPDGGTQATVTPGALSAAVGVYVTTAVARPGSVDFVISAGTVIDGGSVSTTATQKDFEVKFPAMSIAVQMTSFGPIGNAAPDGRAQSSETPGTLSAAVAV
jgi:hypothetical protein